MEKSLIAPPGLWAGVLSAAMLAGSLIVIAVPDARSFPVRALLMVAAIVAFSESLVRLRRAKGLDTPVRELGRHLPASPHFTESLARIAMIVTSLTLIFAF